MATKISNDVSDAVKKINWDDMEEILVQIRPWVRIDGSLNRRVLDRYSDNSNAKLLQLGYVCLCSNPS